MLLSLHLPWTMRARVGDEGAPNGGEVMFFVRKASRILGNVKETVLVFESFGSF